MNKQEIDFGAIKSNAQTVLKQATEALDHVSENAAVYVRGMDRSQAVRFVRRYPIPVTLAAVGLGFVLGSVFSRTND